MKIFDLVAGKVERLEFVQACQRFADGRDAIASHVEILELAHVLNALDLGYLVVVEPQLGEIQVGKILHFDYLVRI